MHLNSQVQVIDSTLCLFGRFQPFPMFRIVTKKQMRPYSTRLKIVFGPPDKTVPDPVIYSTDCLKWAILKQH